MRRAFAAIVTLGVVLAVHAAEAAPAPPVSFALEVGSVSRDIEEEGGPPVGTAAGIADSSRVTARLSVQVAPPLALFGEIGFADLSIDEFDFYHADLSPRYGGGVRIMLSPPETSGALLVYSDVTVSRLSTDDRVVICVATCATTPVEEPADEEIAWTEYAVSIGVKGRFEGLRPFGGLRVSKLEGTDHVRTPFLPPADPNFVDVRLDVRQRDPLGFFFGVDIPLDREERSAVTIQLSGIDENAFLVAYKVAF